MKQLSIIIPMYNVEPYVERCLRSLEDQDIYRDEYEIICINDGSPDDSPNIVRRMQKEFGNIILIDQENQGVSRARNNGIDIAKGKYLLFIDPDDFIDANSFKNILEIADQNKAQVTFLGFSIFNLDGTLRNRVLNNNHPSQIFSGTVIYSLARGEGKTDPDRMWAILFDREFLNFNALRFLPDVPYLEDGELIARILCLAERCIFYVHSFYQRTTRPGSATNSKLFLSEKATNGFLLAARNLRRFQTDQNLDKKQKVFLNQPIAKFVLLAINSSIGWRLYRKFRETVKKLKASGFRKIKLAGCGRSYRIFGTAYNLSPFLGAFTLITYPMIYRFLQYAILKKLR